MSQIIKSLAAGPVPPDVPTTFVTDSGNAIPAANILNVFGSDGIATSGAGNTITLTITGELPNYVNVTGPATYVVAADDYFISCDSTLGAITVQLPNSPAIQFDTFVVKDRTGTASTNNVTVTTVGGVVTIDGATSVVFTDQYESIEVLWNGTSYEGF